MSHYEILIGDCIDTLKTLPAESVHTCVTSPPYFGLRDYNVEGQLGAESTPDEFVDALVRVFREVRRVLRDDGTVWLNLGDSYNAYNGNRGALKGTANQRHHEIMPKLPKGSGLTVGSLKNKDLIGIPWRVAFALQADCWCLRQDIIWHKSNPMPESVRDRCTKAHEYIFLLSKGSKYYYDRDAAKEDAVGNASGAAATFKRKASKRAQTIPGQGYGTHRAERKQVEYNAAKRNRRSVWTVSTRPYAGAHFATFPPDLIQPCILAGCPESGTVLDPFGGSGTTAGVALAHGRNAILCEINPEYAELVPERVAGVMKYYGAKLATAFWPKIEDVGDFEDFDLEFDRGSALDFDLEFET